MSAPVALPGDLVEVVSDDAAGPAGHTWLTDDSTGASTVEICRATRLTERITVAPSGI